MARVIASQRRARAGGDVALYEAVFSLMESLLPEFDMTGFVRSAAVLRFPASCLQIPYTTRDGKYVVIGANGDAISAHDDGDRSRGFGNDRLSPATTGGWRTP